ncbi:MAG: restriction endonuclease subunit S [Clostridia bacterium]|nr:restriction endonuclease subunit S [Clostridia bacterium]
MLLWKSTSKSARNNSYKNTGNILAKIPKRGGVLKPLDSLQWREFFLTDIFSEIRRGKRLKREHHKKGTAPYVSSSALSNGVDNFVANKDSVRIFENCLTLANSGSVGACYYHPYSFVASDHVTSLQNPKFNKFHYLFLSTIISRFAEKYNFNREINDLRISREKVLLPTDESGLPNYVYMEQYGKMLMLQKYQQYLNYISA